MTRKRLHLLVLLILLSAVATAAVAQTGHGTITGTVSDPSGAVVSGTEVVATQVATQSVFNTTTNDKGSYSLVELPIGTYTLTFDKSGFKRSEHTGIVLETQHKLQVNVTLLVGAMSETVQVTATPVLELQTEVGTNMNAREMTDLPLSVNGGRDITNFAFAVTPNVNGNEWMSSIAGSQAFTKSVMIDGTSTDSGAVGHIAESEPSMDAIQEAQVDVTGLRAEDGRSGGGAFMYEMKSGTDHFHGAAFGFLANEFLNANTWLNKWYLSQCAGNAACEQENRRAKDRYSDYGFSGGGPLWKKRRMFIFAAYEKYDQADWRVNTNGGTVPTTKMLNGDFSELLSAAASAQGSTTCPTSPCPLWTNGYGSTPYKDSVGNTIYYGSIFSPRRTVYSNNIITDPISSVSQKVVSLYKSNYQPTLPGVANNYSIPSNGFPLFTQTQLSFKYDWDVASNDHVASSYIYNLRPRTALGNIWQAGTQNGGPLTNSTIQTVISNEYRISERHTFTSHLVNVAAFTFNAFLNKRVPKDPTQDGSQLGFGSLDKESDFPAIGFSGGQFGESSIGTTSPGGYVSYNGILNDSLSWEKGRHTVQFGVEYRELGFNSDTISGGLGFQFSNTTFAPFLSGAIVDYTGSAFANFLLGQVSSASDSVAFSLDSRRKELSFFAQDDYRVSPKLTISADLRWELTRPLHVLHGHWSNFDVNAASQPYGGIKGAVTWLNNPNGSFETYTDWHQFAPKVGGAYQVTDKIVARASFGINFVPLGWNGYSGVPYGSSVGYSGVNRVQEVSQQAPAFQWDSGYPGVYTPPTGPQPSSTYIPWGPANVDPHTRQLGLTENWFAGVQYQLPGNAVIEGSYIGNSGRNLHDGALVPTNFPTWSTYQTLLNSGNISNWVSDPASAAASGVPYPYAGFGGPAYFAINPYPHVQANYDAAVAFTNSPIGQSGYNAFTVEGKKQRGELNLDLSYNWARSTGNTGSAFIDTWNFYYGFQDPYKYKWEAHWPHTNDIVKGYATYILPFGQGRKFLSGSRLLDMAVGGWTISGIVSYGNGGQMGAISSSNYYPGWSGVYTNVAANPNFKNRFKRYNPAWNPTVAGAGSDPGSLFVDPSNFSNPTYGQLGNSPSLFTNWRGWAAPQESASLLKKTHFGPDNRYVVTLRAEFFDLFNRHYWSGPNTNISSGYFGHVTGVSGNRTGQLGARFEW